MELAHSCTLASKRLFHFKDSPNRQDGLRAGDQEVEKCPDATPRKWCHRQQVASNPTTEMCKGATVWHIKKKKTPKKPSFLKKINLKSNFAHNWWFGSYHRIHCLVSKQPSLEKMLQTVGMNFNIFKTQQQQPAAKPFSTLTLDRRHAVKARPAIQKCYILA